MITEDVYNLTYHRVCIKEDGKTVPIVITVPHAKITYDESQANEKEIEAFDLKIIPKNNILYTIQLEEE